ncbi:MAG: penicillin-binding transpeptidase domain-containing protein [Dehalococcoidia bacterium]
MPATLSPVVGLATNVVVLIGLLWTAVSAVRLLRGTVTVPALDDPLGRTSQPIRAAATALAVPFLLVFMGFLASGAVRSVFACAALLLVGGAFFGAMHLLRATQQRRNGLADPAPVGADRAVPGPAVAVVLLTAVLTLVGALLAVRLVVAPDPSVDLVHSVTSDATWEFVRTVVVPLGAIWAVLLGTYAVTRHGAESGLSWARRLRGFGAATLDWTGASSAQPPPGRPFARRIATGFRTYLPELVIGLAALAPFLGGGLRLNIFGFATPEYAKIAYLWVLAVMLSAYAVRMVRLNYLFSRHILRPLLVFGAFAIGAALRSDFGPLLPILVASLAMLWSTLRTEAGVIKPDAHSLDRLGPIMKAARPLALPALTLLALSGVVAQIDYVQRRGAVWEDPWLYNWSSPCIPAPDAIAIDVPSNASLCQEALTTFNASRQAQISQSLSVVADGGVWGRGLEDTVSGRLPAGSTDFVLSVMWNKLGGLTVLATSILAVLLAIALVRTRRALLPTIRGSGATPERLFVVGVATLLLGQYTYAYLAVLNVLPHTGLPVPLLSRGGQSTLTVLLAVTAAVAMCFRRANQPTAEMQEERLTASRPGASGRPVPSSGRTAALPASLTVLTVFLLVAVIVTVRPYSGHAEDLPLCLRPTATVDPDMCSTDRIRSGRTPVELRFDGRVQYVRNPQTQRWEAPEGTEPSLSLEDLAGVLDIGDGTGGLVDVGFVQGTAGNRPSSLSDRLTPAALRAPETADVTLSLDPIIQKAVAGALRADDGPSPPLAGGVVVLDAATGDILGVSSVPTLPYIAPGDEPLPPDEAAVEARRDELLKFDEDNPMLYHRPDGSIDESSEETCDGYPDPDVEQRCYQVVAYDAVRPGRAEQDKAAQRHYVGDDPNVPLPGANINRAVGARYHPGSAFKVVVAAAFIKEGGTARSRIDAPPEIPRAGTTPLRNPSGPCKRVEGGTMTLTDALAVSCNTAFAKLGQDLRWEKVQAMAADLGFGPTFRGPAWTSGPPIGISSVAPPELQGDVPSASIGGGDVEATPLQMATVLAMAGNKGTAVAPRLAVAARTATAAASTPLPVQSRKVLTPAQAAELKAALSQTTEQGGTAAALEVPRDHHAYVKTGTHEIHKETEVLPGVFTYQHAWLTGFIDVGDRTYAFATALETRNEDEGRTRVREITKKLLEAVVEARR